MPGFYSTTQNCLFAFNIWDISSARAVMDAAAQMNQDVILQTSASVYRDILPARFREFVSGYQCDLGIKAYINLDHCKDPEMLRDAVDRGWDSVMIDASSEALEDNIRLTGEIASYAHAHNVLVEAEVGAIKGVEDDIEVIDEALASREDIKTFLDSTDIDLIAVAFGNAHGEYRTPPNLHYDLVEYTTSITDIPFVVHGGSGLSDAELKRLIAIPGVRKINISTEVKLAYRAGILRAEAAGLLEQSGFQATKVDKLIREEIEHLVISKLGLI